MPLTESLFHSLRVVFRPGRIFAAVGLWLACALTLQAGKAEPPRGLPYIRTYPFDEIGNVPRGLRLGFDHFGRVAVMYDGIYAVLNDTAWVDRIDTNTANSIKMTTVVVANGQYYYGGRGSWGLVETTRDGRFRPRPLVPENAPDWTRVTPFNKILVTSRGIYFYELSGLVFWDFQQRRSVFYNLPRITTVFTVNHRVFVASDELEIREIDEDTETATVRSIPGLTGHIVSQAVPLDDQTLLLGLRDGRLVTFDGETVKPWAPQQEHRIVGNIAALERLIGGGVAVAIQGKGVYLISSNGDLRWFLNVPEFLGIRSLAAGEQGVLWMVGENAVHRVYYDSPLTSFGPHHGLTARWPQVGLWKNKIVISSMYSLFELAPQPPGHAPFCRTLVDSSERQVNALAARGEHLLAGTVQGVVAVKEGGAIEPVITIENVSALDFLDDETCVVLGTREIACLQWKDGRWQEAVPRLPGVGDSPIRTRHYRDLWVELGGNQVMRLSWREGRLQADRLATPWPSEQWINVGRVGSTIVLSGASEKRVFYDELRNEWVDAPGLNATLSRSPFWLLHVDEDPTGRLWATHARGIVTFTPQEGTYRLDATSFELRNDSYPAVVRLSDEETWIVSGHSLYRISPEAIDLQRSPSTVLVSLVADDQILEILDPRDSLESPPQFSFDDNSLSFRFFSGSYAWRIPPRYEFRLGPSESWTPVDPSLVLRFPKMRDGSYLLEVRRLGGVEPDARSFTLPFIIRPPWYRTTLSYGIYALLVLFSFFGLAAWINARSLQRSASLEKLVKERTRELEIAMEKLGDESRNAATLAERSRLAGEIHDSLQQGLSGTLYHLDATLTHPDVTPELQGKLSVMRNMLSYAREEVQQAVWNLESPLLHNATLGEALRKLASYIHAGQVEVRVETEGETRPLESSVQHNLLRIAQEAITNAVKHAKANRIEVLLAMTPHRVALTVSDDGEGFDTTRVAGTGGHLGLRSFHARAKAIQGELTVQSDPGRGTTIRIELLTTKPAHVV